MRILISAIACEPNGYSEGYVGWSAINALGKEHHLTVLTHVRSQSSIETALLTHPLRERLSFTYLGKLRPWHPNRMIARFQSWLDYRSWCKDARLAATRLVSESHFDIAHHVTYATWRMGSPLAGLGVPWIFGPIGGGEILPKQFFCTLSLNAGLFECLRMLAGWFGRHSRRIRFEVNNASLVVANNCDTARMLGQLGVTERRLRVISQSFLTGDKLQAFQISEKQRPGSGPLRIFAGGNLEGRKGVAIALNSLVKLKDKGVPFRFVYGGRGPEYSFLCQLAETLGFDKKSVSLGNLFSFDEYQRQLQESHVYLLPSLREGAPLTMLEAMQSGCVPVVAKCGGAAMTVTEDCGFALQPTNPEDLAIAIADVLEQLWKSPDLLQKLSLAAVERVREYATEDVYLSGIREAYKTALHI